jgi:DNA-binding transcriptional ArsR family regulator
MRDQSTEAPAIVGHFSSALEQVPGTMSSANALAALSALGQQTRLEIFQMLMRHAATGLAAGAIARAVRCPHNTVSSHLAILARTGLIRATRQGRGISYAPEVETMRALMRFLVDDCCGGHPELCHFPVAQPSCETCK